MFHLAHPHWRIFSPFPLSFVLIFNLWSLGHLISFSPTAVIVKFNVFGNIEILWLRHTCLNSHTMWWSSVLMQHLTLSNCNSSSFRSSAKREILNRKKFRKGSSFQIIASGRKCILKRRFVNKRFYHNVRVCKLIYNLNKIHEHWNFTQFYLKEIFPGGVYHFQALLCGWLWSKRNLSAVFACSRLLQTLPLSFRSFTFFMNQYFKSCLIKF